MKVAFWFEFASTYSYPAALQIESIAGDDVEIIWRPFLLGPVFAAQGLNASPFSVYPVKGAYMWRDMERLCAAAGLAYRKPSEFPRGSLIAARVAAGHATAPWLPAFVRAVFHANFADDRAIQTPEVVQEILQDLDLDAAEVLARAQSQPVKDTLRNTTEHAIAHGIFGAPSFVVGDEVFWGHDRMQAAFDWARNTADGASG